MHPPIHPSITTPPALRGLGDAGAHHSFTGVKVRSHPRPSCPSITGPRGGKQQFPHTHARQTIQSCQLAPMRTFQCCGKEAQPWTEPTQTRRQREHDRTPRRNISWRPPAAVVRSKAAYKTLCQPEVCTSPRMLKID